MCLPPTMMTGGLVGHTIAQANKPDEETNKPLIDLNEIISIKATNLFDDYEDFFVVEWELNCIHFGNMA